MRKQYTSGIYLIKNNVSGRVYIGQSKYIEKIRTRYQVTKTLNNIEARQAKTAKKQNE